MRPVMRAMDNEWAGAHRRKSGETPRDPVGRPDVFDCERVGCSVIDCKLHQLAQLCFIRRGPEMDRHLPPAAFLERCTYVTFVVEGFAEISREPAGGRFVASQTG